MALDFPSSPAIGAVFTSGGLSYMWDGVAWNAIETQASSFTPGVYKISEGGPVSGVAFFDIAYPVGYRNFELFLNGLYPATNSNALNIRLSYDNGATYKAGASDYSYSCDYATNAATSGWAQFGNAGTTFMSMTTANSNDPLYAGHLIVRHSRPIAAGVARFTWEGAYKHTLTTPSPPYTASSSLHIRGSGYAGYTGPITNVRIIVSTGNIVCDNWQLNGIK